MVGVVSSVRCVALCTTVTQHFTRHRAELCTQGTPHDGPRPLYSALLVVQMSPNSCIYMHRVGAKNITICIVAVVIVVISCSCCIVFLLTEISLLQLYQNIEVHLFYSLMEQNWCWLNPVYHFWVNYILNLVWWGRNLSTFEYGWRTLINSTKLWGKSSLLFFLSRINIRYLSSNNSGINSLQHNN